MTVTRICFRITGVSCIGIKSIPKAPQFTSTTFMRSKVTLPELPYDYGALEPSISGKIMEIHHQNHHQTYVNGLNTVTEQLQEAVSKQDVASQISLQPLIKFHGGGHVNHSLFWQNLAPSKNGGGGQPEGDLMKAIKETYSSFGNFKSQFSTALAGIQGSGWGWLVKDNETGNIQIRTYANQDPVVGRYTPLLGIDAWEHAYYLQYQNRKVEYFNRIWNVINWKTVEERFK
ncbi:BgTH12-03143 [Blumeria graminis f. sp. triticale]|uniref:Superoxide dismutase n=3 Tax=Blumeria graminis TaxID=34373 RepID=A0A061HGT9_BLUGR|nr:Mitochondrial superoxide dismutase [Blumeria graminis f. sp. tritici 96224]CAD6503480.1 BgTH12-03143 [Blumeria graminis f. sp. triticale]VDB89576.1 Bgt-1590 [Blumeria graminis f. sp. tritici]